jgi:hypothetical protein
MKKTVFYLCLLFAVQEWIRKKKFKNQGEQENYWTGRTALREYVKQSFKKNLQRKNYYNRQNKHYV